MCPPSHPTPPLCLPRPPRPSPAGRRILALMAAAAGALIAGCASTPTPAELQARAVLPLQATSLQPVPLVMAAPTSVPPLPAPLVTEPWMAEQLRKLDDRYAQAAADTRAVVQQSVTAMNGLVTPSHLAPLRSTLTKLESQISSASARTDALLTDLQDRVKALEHAVSEAQASRPREVSGAPSEGTLPAPDGETQGYLAALKALQATPWQTLPLRAWLEVHPTHPKAPEALLELGMAFLDSGSPTAAKYYFKQLIDNYSASLQATEAKALAGFAARIAPKRAPKRTAKLAPKPTAAPASTKPPCDPKAPCSPSPGSAEPAPGPGLLKEAPAAGGPAVKPAPAAPGPTKAPATSSAAPTAIAPTAAQSPGLDQAAPGLLPRPVGTLGAPPGPTPTVGTGPVKR